MRLHLKNVITSFLLFGLWVPLFRSREPAFCVAGVNVLLLQNGYYLFRCDPNWLQTFPQPFLITGSGPHNGTEHIGEELGDDDAGKTSRKLGIN